jgi:hypothetical protein
MSAIRVMPFLRRTSYLVSPAILAICLTVSPAARAQAAGNSFGTGKSAASDTLPTSDNFSSSTEAIDAPGAGGSGATVAPAAAAGQSDNSYGYHHNGYLSRLTFEGGGGFNAPIGNDQPFITWGGNITVGGGLRLQKHISVLAEYQFLDNKLPGGLIAEAGAQGGHAHIWSLTLDPVIDFFPSRKNDIYITGGGGFYRKVTSFTDPEEIEICYYFCEVGVQNVVVSHFSSKQGGANFGIGFTHKLGGDEHLKAFAEARYLWIDTPAIGETDGLGKTELIPVTFGVRW